MPTVCGGITAEAQEADDRVKEICEQVKDDLQAKTGRQFEEFTPLTYRSQLVNGINYFVKVRVSGEEHFHIRVHKSFQGEITLCAHEDKKSLQDEIKYFQ